MTLVGTSSETTPPSLQEKEADLKRRNNEKCLRYYYRHREELRDKRIQKLMDDPDYVAKQTAKEEAKRVREEEKEAKKAAKEAAKKAKEEAKRMEREEAKETRRRLKAAQLGI